ncbi:hypothetical protein ACHAQJ_000574 [Trichoderma viride]
MPIRFQDAPKPLPELPSEDPTELEQLVVDDSDGDGEGEGNNTLIKTSSASSALNVVRTKLIRHISNDNEANRRSRVSAGHSQEEVARRAELRRFRHQRIQEELKTEEGNAESSNTSHRSTCYLSPLIDAGQPRIGPRDTIEFIVTDGHHLSATQVLMQDLAPDDTPKEEICSAMQKKGEVTKPASTLAVPDKDDKDQAPPLRPPSTHSNRSQKMAGCSYNVPRLDRVLGTDNEFNIRHGAHAWEEQSTLGIWLAAQGMRSRSSSIRPGGGEANDKSVRDQVFAPYENFGAIDSAADALLPIHCQDINKVKPQDQGDSFESASFVSSLSNDRTIGDADTTSLGRNILSSSRALDIATTKPVDNSSSNYPSVLPSFQPSPNRSQPDFHHLSAEDLESLELSPFSWQGNFSVIKSIQASEGKSSYATAEDDIFYSDNNASSTQIICPPAQVSAGATSLACSGTADVHQREAKARTIGTRFSDALSRKKSSLNFGSHFKEEFHASSTGSGGRSFMAKINLSVPRRFKYSSNSFGTVQSRHYSNERDPLALARADTNGGVRPSTPPNRSSPFHQEGGGFLTSDLSPATIKHMYDSRKPLIPRQSAIFETSRLTPHSDELLPDETQSSSRRILQQWTTNIQEAFSPNSTPKPTKSKLQKRLTKVPLHSGDERATVADAHRLQPDGGRNSVSDTLLLESGSRFRPTKLKKTVRSGFKKLILSHDSERQSQLSRPSENRRHQDENEKHLQSKIVRTDTLSIESDHLKVAMKETAICGIAPSNQHLSADSTSCRRPSSLVIKNTTEIICTTNAIAANVGLEMPKPAKEPHKENRMESRSIDVIPRPWSRLKVSEEREVEPEGTDSTSAISDTRALRRWKSTLDVPMNRRSSLNWTGGSMAQSLSLSNLRA